MFLHDMVLVFLFSQVFNEKTIAKQTSLLHTSINGEDKSIRTLSRCMRLRSVLIQVSFFRYKLFVINSEPIRLIGNVQQISTTRDTASSKQANSCAQLVLRQ